MIKLLQIIRSLAYIIPVLINVRPVNSLEIIVLNVEVWLEIEYLNQSVVVKLGYKMMATTLIVHVTNINTNTY